MWITRKFHELIYPNEPVTYREALVFAGMVKGKSIAGKAYNIFLLILIPTSILHFLLKILFEPEDLDTPKVMEIIHWSIMYFTCWGSLGDMIKNSDLLNEIHRMIKSGIYTYPEPLSDEQIAIIEKEKSRIRFYVKMFFTIFTLAFLCMQLKPVTSTGNEYILPYIGWFPFKVNSFGKYVAGHAFQLVVGWNIALPAHSLVAFYMVTLCHLCSQLGVLNISMKNLLKETKHEKNHFKTKVKACVEHHNAILRYSKILQQYIFIPMLLLAGAMVLLLCTTCFILTDPNSDFIVIIPLFTVFIPEIFMAVLFCYAGQRVTNHSEELGLTLYNIKWYNIPQSNRREVLIMMIKCKKLIKITGGGIQTYNLEGLKDILQAAYTYFNMLVALRKS